jgi:hypothetical protein
VIVRTVSALRAPASPGTVSHRVSTWTNDAKDAESSPTAITDDSWRTADGTRSKTYRSVVGPDPGPGQAMTSAATIYRNGSRAVEVARREGKLRAVDLVRHGELRHSLYDFFSNMCQDCHSTRYETGKYMLQGAALAKRMTTASTAELLAQRIESANSTVDVAGPNTYKITVPCAEPSSTLTVWVRASDFAITSWDYATRMSPKSWALKSSETIPESSLPRDFFRSAVPLRKNGLPDGY